MPKQKPFKKLRDALYVAEISQADLAEALNCCYLHVNRLLGGKTSWRLDEMYITLELINATSLDEYFPKGGYAA